MMLLRAGARAAMPRVSVRTVSTKATNANASSSRGASWLKAAGVATGGAVMLTGATHSMELELHVTDYPFDHKGPMSAFDAGSIRRGHEVYKNICATCHSLERIAYRNLVGVCYTEEEAKAMAQEIEVVDGPNDEGEMFERAGKLSDAFPSPYPNEEAGRAANGGALPPDLSLIAKSRHGGVDYLFALLTGYRDAPEGVTFREGLYYNPYFPGGKIGMPPPLQDGGLEYSDGTEATISQMAKDVSVFLNWAAEPEHDDRKRQGVKWVGCMCIMACVAGYYKRFRWAPLKSRKISYRD